MALVLPVTVALGFWGRKLIFRILAGISALFQIIPARLLSRAIRHRLCQRAGDGSFVNRQRERELQPKLYDSAGSPLPTAGTLAAGLTIPKEEYKGIAFFSDPHVIIIRECIDKIIRSLSKQHAFL